MWKKLAESGERRCEECEQENKKIISKSIGNFVSKDERVYFHPGNDTINLKNERVSERNHGKDEEKKELLHKIS